ncbi:FUSC family protein [Actinomycetospora sp. OC33-EN08]|uniref:FUSC family protein n=1 Tax=Actinomycetospora aurantiaca TaxID=3129233 RepID=A0ABU8MN35_9PSEU
MRVPLPVRAALRPLPDRWGVLPGLRATAAAAVVLGLAVAVSDPSVGGIAYLGVACAVSFVGSGGARSRTARVAGQAVGAAAGMALGALVPATAGWVVPTAAGVGFVAGALGRIGPASTGAALMAVVGVAYAQFDRLPVPWWEPVLAYLLGSTVVLAFALAESATLGRHDTRRAVAAVWDAAADLVLAPDEDSARHRLAEAWATAHEAVVGYRRRPAGRADWAGAREAAVEAARLAAVPTADLATRSELARRWRSAAMDARDQPSDDRPPRWRSVVRPALEPAALWSGARVGACVGVATCVALLLHSPAHAFWIPLTVAVVVRPEYGSVLVRSVHRLLGTVVGVAVVAGLLEMVSSPVAIAVVAALSLGSAAFGATRSYGVAVAGITGSALFSTALTSPAGFDPWARLVDTVVGCAVALVVGVLLWPRRGLHDQSGEFARATVALAEYAERPGRTTADAAYHRAHRWREQLGRDVTEPDPARAAADWLPVAHRLEHVVDLVSAEARPDVAHRLRARPGTAAEAGALLDLIAEMLHTR